LKKKKLLLDKLLRDDNEEDKPKSNFITKYLDKRRKSQSPNNYAKTYDFEQNDILKQSQQYTGSHAELIKAIGRAMQAVDLTGDMTQPNVV
jgi:hypothetical protein